MERLTPRLARRFTLRKEKRQLNSHIAFMRKKMERVNTQGNQIFVPKEEALNFARDKSDLLKILSNHNYPFFGVEVTKETKKSSILPSKTVYVTSIIVVSRVDSNTLSLDSEGTVIGRRGTVRNGGVNDIFFSRKMTFQDFNFFYNMLGSTVPKPQPKPQN
jgi:hypothetical protein